MCWQAGEPQLHGDKAPVFGTMLNLTSCASSSVAFYNKLTDISEVFSGFCELFQYIIKPEEGVVGDCRFIASLSEI